jgi:hypothetical protein
VDDVQNPFGLAAVDSDSNNSRYTQANGRKGRRMSQSDVSNDGEAKIDVLDMVLRDRFYEQHDGAISAIATLPKPELAHTPAALEHNRSSEVLRRVNDGFEILKPGTISEPPNPTPQARARSHDKNKRHSRRLSKERPSTGARNRNSFIDVLYGNENRPRFS